MNHSGDSTAQTTGSFDAPADVGAQRVAQVYAEALFDAAGKRNELDETLEELRAIVVDLFRAVPKFEEVLGSAAVGRERKEAFLRANFTGHASELLINFLLVLNEHDRLSLLRPILDAVVKMNNDRKGLMPVQVRSAVPLPDDQREQLMARLRDTFHREPVLEAHTDPDLLGGLVVRVGDWVYDASVRTQLDNIRNNLLEGSSHEIQTGRDRFGNIGENQ